MLQAPSDNVFVEITKRYDDEIKYQSGVKLYIDPSYNPNFHATSEGIVHSVPVSLGPDNADINPIIRPGDEVLFSYKTVGDITFQDNTDHFRMTTKQEGYFTEWMNQDRWTLRIEKGMKDHQWSAVYLDQHGDLVAGKVGKQGECENWVAANFKFATGEGFEYDNRLYYKDKELWKVDYNYIFAIRRKGHMQMVSDYLLVEPIVENIPRFWESTGILNANGDRMCIQEHKGWLRCGERGTDGIRNGDVLHFDPNMKEKYNVQGKPMYIVRKRFLLGKEISASAIEGSSLN